MIAYLDAEHDSLAVVRTLVEANPKLTARKSRCGLRWVLRHQGQHWGEAASTVLDEYYESSDYGPDHREVAETRDCPLWRDSYEGWAADHPIGCSET